MSSLAARRRYWCEWLWDGVHAAPQPGMKIEVDGGLVVSVAPSPAAPEDSVRLGGLTVPGLANAHSHAFHRALRGRTHGGGGSFWTWRDTMYERAAALTPDSYFKLARATYGEMVLAGFTAVGEFHYLHHDAGGRRYQNANAMGEAMLAAAADVGIRITLLDTCYLRGGFDAALNPVQQRFSDGSAAAWAERVATLRPGVAQRVGAAIHSVRAVDPLALTEVARFAAAGDLPLHAHVSEQPAENDQCLAAFGCTPVELLRRCDVLSDRLTMVHATHLTAEDLAVIAGSGAIVLVCPTTERDLADGIGPTRELRDRGVPLCVGTDSHALIDPFEELRAIELNQRLLHLVRGDHQPDELLASATTVGYRSLGWPSGGRIAAGALADFTTVSFDSVRLAGTQPGDFLGALVFAASAPDVSSVVVNGIQIVRSGRHRALDVAAALANAV